VALSRAPKNKGKLVKAAKVAKKAAKKAPAKAVAKKAPTTESTAKKMLRK